MGDRAEKHTSRACVESESWVLATPGMRESREVYLDAAVIKKRGKPSQRAGAWRVTSTNLLFLLISLSFDRRWGSTAAESAVTHCPHPSPFRLGR